MRPPTSHERRAGRAWDESYRDGPPPWDIGGPQPAVARLVEAGRFGGSVLDAGCGSGENALLIASSGLAVLGVDVAETAIAMAREKARDRGIDAEFAVADALDLGRLGRRFETVLDCALFHTFEEDEERGAYVAGLAAVTEPGATLLLLCFSDAGPGPAGPHPVSEAELRAAFGEGWRVVAIEPDELHARFGENGFPAWLARIERVRSPARGVPGPR